MNERKALTAEVRAFLRTQHQKLEKWSHAQIVDMLLHPCSPLMTLPMLCPGSERCSVRTACTVDDAAESIHRPCQVERRMALELFLDIVAHCRIGRHSCREIDAAWSLIRIALQKRRYEVRLLADGVDPETIEAVYQGKRRLTSEESSLPTFQGLLQTRQQALWLRSALRRHSRREH